MDGFSPYITIGGMAFDLPTCLMIVVTSIIVFLFIFYCTRRMTVGAPKGKQNMIEWVIDFVRGIAGQFMEQNTATKFVTLAFTLFLYILFSNLLELVFMVTVKYSQPVPAIHITQAVLNQFHGEVPVTWWKSTTAAPSVTFSLAIMVLLYAHYLGLKRGPGKYIKHYFEPHWGIFPLHIMEEFVIKPLTLPLRLFGNIFAGEVLIVVLLGVSTVVAAPLMIIWLGYSVFIGAIQAFIFTTLSMVYISQKLESDH